MQNENLEVISEEFDESSTQNNIYHSRYHRNNGTTCISDFEFLILLGKSTIGIGLFAMPYAFSCVGLLFGIILLITIGFFITICLRLLLKIHRVTCTRTNKSAFMYDDIVEVVLKITCKNIPKIFMSLATYLTNGLLIFYYIGMSTTCVDFIGDIFRKIADFEETEDPSRYTMILFPIYMLINLSDNLCRMIFNSMIGNILILNVTIIGLVYGGQNDNGKNWTVVKNYILLYPRFLGIIFCSLSSPGLVLAMEHNKKNPWNSNGVLDQGMFVIVFLYTIIGIVGYVKWGSNVSENFIHNIQEEADGYALLAFIMQALGIYLTYGLLCYVPISIVLKQYVIPIIDHGIFKGTPYLWDLIIRFTVTLVTCVLPKFIPRSRLRIALLGLTCNFILTIFLPLLLYTLLYIETLQRIDRRNLKLVTLIFFIILTTIIVFSCFVIELSLIS